MFEDSLVESEGRIRTHSQWFAVGSFFLQAALLLLLLLFPLFHPEALPRHFLERLLIAPPPPAAPAPVEAHRTPSSPRRESVSLQTQLQAPSKIPAHTSTNADALAPPSPFIGDDLGGGVGPAGLPGGINLGSPPAIIVARPPAVPKRPVAISSGVAAGQLLRPIQPIYPAIARQARIQGTVVIEATISRQGTIENLRVLEGPPLLRQAAIDAVASARYKPFLLNGEPVAVQTTVQVIFSLGE